MKQKYSIKKDDTKSTLVIKEYSELDKEIMSFMGEQEYDQEDIVRAIAATGDELVNVLRNNDFYPPRVIADQLAEKITEIYNADINDAVEILLNDADFLAKEESKEDPVIPEIEDDGGVAVTDVDDLLEDDLDDDLGDSENIGETKTPIKIADAETLDSDIEINSES